MLLFSFFSLFFLLLYWLLRSSRLLVLAPYMSECHCTYSLQNFQSCNVLSKKKKLGGKVQKTSLDLFLVITHVKPLIYFVYFRNKHPNEVFSSMEKIMTLIIHNNVDNDEFSLVLVRILLNRLRRENKVILSYIVCFVWCHAILLCPLILLERIVLLSQNVSSLSFQLAENTFKNCSAELKKYLPEAVKCSDFPIDDYAEVVVSCFQDATQRETTVCLLNLFTSLWTMNEVTC